MTRQSYDLNDLHGDVRNLSILISVITEKAVENPDINDLTGLLWIARDLAEHIVTNSEDVCSSQNIVKASCEKAN